MPLIDADTLWKVFENAGWWDNADRDVAQDLLDKAPTVDAEPVRHGYWRDGVCYEVCSVCGAGYDRYDAGGYLQDFAYCPACGAKMDEDATCNEQ